MRYVALLLLASFALAAVESKKDEIRPKEDNPFGVDLGGKGVDEKVLDPNLTPEEEAIFKKHTRAGRDGSLDRETQAATDAAFEAFIARWSSGATKWTDSDFRTRMKIRDDMVRRLQFDSYVKPFSEAIIAYVAKDSDPAGFVSRMQATSALVSLKGSAYVEMPRKMVNKFLEQEKLAKATAAQKYKFVANFLLPKLSSSSSIWKRELETLAKDFEEDLKLEQPGEPKKKGK